MLSKAAGRGPRSPLPASLTSGEPYTVVSHAAGTVPLSWLSDRSSRLYVMLPHSGGRVPAADVGHDCEAGDTLDPSMQCQSQVRVATKECLACMGSWLKSHSMH